MINFETSFEKLEKNLPEFLRPIDLVKSGLFSSKSDVCKATKRGKAPPCIKLSERKVIFMRESLIEWLREQAKEDQQRRAEENA